MCEEGGGGEWWLVELVVMAIYMARWQLVGVDNGCKGVTTG